MTGVTQFPEWGLRIGLVAGGGAAGSVARYLLSGWLQSKAGISFPWGTLGVNVLGCLCIGFLGAALSGPLLLPPGYRLFLIVGVLGGFTTFSAFGWETLALAREGQMRLALLNIGLSNVLGLTAAWSGMAAARKLFGV